MTLARGTDWPISIFPLPDEILSSWLSRTAHAYGEMPHTLAKAIWGDLQVWTRDLDQCLSVEAVNHFGLLMRVPLNQARRTRLDSFKRRLPQNSASQGLTPGLLAIGVHHRLRKRHGQQYCPSCLRDDPWPYLRREWRLAFLFSCLKHCCLLRDACPYCDTPLIAHRAPGLRIDHCHSCGINLAEPTRQLSAFEKATQLQFMRFWEKGEASIGDVCIPFVEWFSGIRLLFAASRNPRFSGGIPERLISLFPNQPHAMRPYNIEMSRIDDRAQWMSFVFWLIDDWPGRFSLITRRAGIRGYELIDPRRKIKAPQWLLDATQEYLPYKTRHQPKRKTNTKHSNRFLRMSAQTARHQIDLSEVMAARTDMLGNRLSTQNARK